MQILSRHSRVSAGASCSGHTEPGVGGLGISSSREEPRPASASAPSGAARIFRYYDDHVAIVRDSAARTKIESECALLLFFAKKVGKIKSKYDELVLVTYLSGAGQPQGHKLFATLKQVFI